jgi:hypothetical protein
VAICKAAVAAAAVACGTVALAAAELTPPAVSIADRYLTITAILVAAAVLAAVGSARRALDRPERLAAVVALLATAGAWYAAQMAVHEKQFDYLVASQQSQLQLTAVELSGDILNFLYRRGRGAPPRPAPPTWNRDVAAILQFEDTTAAEFEASFGPEVRKAHDLLALEGLRDPDLEAFYRRPANAFQIDVVARRLAALAQRLVARARVSRDHSFFPTRSF